MMARSTLSSTRFTSAVLLVHLVSHAEQFDLEVSQRQCESVPPQLWQRAAEVLGATAGTVEARVNGRSTGVLTFAELDVLLSRAPEVPRTFGLAPLEASKEIRKKFFDSMEDKRMGGMTLRMLLAWTVEHFKGKIAAQKTGKACHPFLLGWLVGLIIDFVIE